MIVPVNIGLIVTVNNCSLIGDYTQRDDHFLRGRFPYVAGSSGGGGEGKREGDKRKWEITSPVPDTDVLWTASTAREV